MKSTEVKETDQTVERFEQKEQGLEGVEQNQLLSFQVMKDESEWATSAGEQVKRVKSWTTEAVLRRRERERQRGFLSDGDRTTVIHAHCARVLFCLAAFLPIRNALHPHRAMHSMNLIGSLISRY
jgi:hypothetical protein